jgi:hypothetical protein
MAFEPDREAARKFIQQMNLLHFEPQSKADEYIQRARNMHAARKLTKRITGGKNATEIRDKVLSYFTAYRKTRAGQKVHEDVLNMTLGSFLASAEQRKATNA